MASKGRLPRGFFHGGIFSPLPRFLRLPESLLFLVTPAGGFRKTLFYKPSTHMRAQKKRYFPGAKTQGNGEKKRKSRHGKNSRRARNLGPGKWKSGSKSVKPNGQKARKKEEMQNANAVTEVEKITEVAGLKHQLDLLESKEWQDVGVLRLIDFALLGRRGYGRQMKLQVMSYRTSEWILFDPKEGWIRSLPDWYKFVREELGWTHQILLTLLDPE